LLEEAALDGFGIAWRLGATLFLVFLNGFFVAAEFAFVKVRSTRIEALADEGSRRAESVQHILRNLDRYLSGCQLGITLASLGLGALGEPAVARLLVAGAEFAGWDLPEEPGGGLRVVAFLLAFVVITTLHMTLGEQAPKMWALRRSEPMALDTAFALRGFTLVFGPFIAVINAISNSVLRMLGLPQTPGHEASHTAEEIRSVLSLSARTGEISERQYEITENVFRVTELEVRHIVVPRVDVQYISLEWPLEENLRIVRESGHSRFPLCERGLDSIRGFVHVKDVLEQLLTSGAPADLAALARPGLFVSETMPLPGFLIELQAKRAHCAAVVDEHGTVIGLVFREDALEEIVGPLGDEFDVQTQDFLRVRDGVYELSGRVSLPDVCDELELSLDEDADEKADTIGGYVIARLGRLPKAGDKVEVGPYQATVLEVIRRRVQRLRLEKSAAPKPREDDG